MIQQDSEFFDLCLSVLKTSPLFRGLSPPVLENMLTVFHRESWPANSPAMDSHQTQTYFYVIITGRLKVYQINPNTGREQTIFILSPGDVFDVICLLDGEEHEISTESLEELACACAPAVEVRNWIELHPEFNRTFLPYLGRQLRQLEELASDLSLYDTESRFMKLILRHVDHSHPGKFLKLINDLSHEELASLIGSVRAVVNRHVQHLKKDGIIDTHRKQMKIKDLHSLVQKVEERFGLR